MISLVYVLKVYFSYTHCMQKLPLLSHLYSQTWYFRQFSDSYQSRLYELMYVCIEYWRRIEFKRTFYNGMSSRGICLKFSNTPFTHEWMFVCVYVLYLLDWFIWNSTWLQSIYVMYLVVFLINLTVVIFKCDKSKILVKSMCK